MEILLYTEPECGACLDAKQFLVSHGLAFEERDIRANPDYLRILTEDLDSCTTPTLVVGDRIVVGFDKVEYQMLAEHKKAKKLMKTKHIVIVLALFGLALPLAAQMGMGSRPNLSGIFHPVVGAGASYEVTRADGMKNQMEITIVGQEEVSGKPAYWMEMAMANPRSGGDMYMKSLVSMGDSGMTSTRMIMQVPGRDPMEMDLSANPAGRAMSQNTPNDIRDKAEAVGTETITVPAGTFSCQHYRMKDGSGDSWVSDKVAPLGLVKMQGKDQTIVLTKVITDAKDHITGTPKKFDPMQMMRDRQNQQGQ
jgi:glutaredoxin